MCVGDGPDMIRIVDLALFDYTEVINSPVQDTIQFVWKTLL